MATFLRRLRLESLETRQLLAGLLGPDRVEDYQELVSKATVPSVVAVTAENLAGLRSAEMHLSFEAGELDVTAASVKAGTAWQGKASVISKVDEAAGTLNVFVFSVNPIAMPEGELLAVEFDLVDELATDVSAQIALTKFELNEGVIESPAELWFEAEPAESLLIGEPPTASLKLASDILPQVSLPPHSVILRELNARPLAAPSLLPQTAPQVTPQVIARAAPRIQPRVLETPVVGPTQVQAPTQQSFGNFFQNTDWLSKEFRERGRKV